MTGSVRCCLRLISLFVATLIPAGLGAQTVAASVTVMLPGTSGAGVRPLSFGAVTPGSSVARVIGTIADSATAGVGHFHFTGITGNRDVQLTFDFPTRLTHAASGNSMAISFNGSYGLHCFDRTSGAHACTLFNPSPGGADPSVIVVTPAAAPRNGNFRVYLGGSVTAPVDVTAGTYQGLVTLTLTRL